MAQFADLLHQTLIHVDAAVDADEARFLLADGRVFVMLHHQDCCESVSLVDVCGDVADLHDAQVLDAREEVGEDQSGKHESATWTFYILQTDKGAVTLRWLGMSNGYYSEGVSFEERQMTRQEEVLHQAWLLDRQTQQASGRRARVRL